MTKIIAILLCAVTVVCITCGSKAHTKKAYTPDIPADTTKVAEATAADTEKADETEASDTTSAEDVRSCSDSSDKTTGYEEQETTETEAETTAPTTPPTPETEAVTEAVTEAAVHHSPAAAPKYPQIEAEILRMINAYRAEAGVAPLEIDYTYYDCALTRAQECLVYWSHTRPDGRASHTVYDDFGLTVGLVMMGENLAKNFSSTEQIMEMLMASPGHRSNILHPDYTAVTISIVEVEGYEGIYAMSQLFIRKA